MYLLIAMVVVSNVLVGLCCRIELFNLSWRWTILTLHFVCSLSVFSVVFQTRLDQ